MIQIFVFAFFVMLMLYTVSKKKWAISTYMISIYALSAFFSIRILRDYGRYFEQPTLLPSIAYCVLLFIAFKPFIRTKPQLVGFSDEIEEKRFIHVSYIISIFLIACIILVLPKIRFAFDYGIGDIRNDIQSEKVVINETGLTSIGTRLLYYFGNLCYPLLIMFFYSLVNIKGKLTLKFLILIASVSEVVLGILLGGRTNIIYYALFFGFTFVLFYPLLPKKTKGIVLGGSVGIAFIIVLYIMVVSSARFAGRIFSLDYFYETYIGQSYVYFCEYIKNIKWHPYSLQRIFPITSEIFFGSFDLSEYRQLVANNTGYDIGVFYTFLGDLFVDVGIVGMLIYLFSFYGISKKITYGESYDIKKLLYLGIVYQIPLLGVFYYSAYLKYVTFCFILSIIVAKYIKGEIYLGNTNQGKGLMIRFQRRR